jgi:hypothetical protein
MTRVGQGGGESLVSLCDGVGCDAGVLSKGIKKTGMSDADVFVGCTGIATGDESTEVDQDIAEMPD